MKSWRDNKRWAFKSGSGAYFGDVFRDCDQIPDSTISMENPFRCIALCSSRDLARAVLRSARKQNWYSPKYFKGVRVVMVTIIVRELLPPPLEEPA